MSYKVVFAGNPSLATYSLQSLIDDKRFFVSAIVTESDKKVVRKQVLTQTPIKKIWVDNNISIVHPWNSEALKKILEKEKPDFFVIVAYGHILPVSLLNIAKYNINVHLSLLPKFRWASPVQSAILSWEKETWISIMNIEKDMDAWGVWKFLECDISFDDTSEVLFEKLWNLSKSLPDVLDEIMKWRLVLKDQDNKMSSYCKKILKSDWKIDFKKETAVDIYNKLRAFTPWPWIYTFFNWKKLSLVKVIFSNLNEISESRKLWEVFEDDWFYFIKTINWDLRLIELQLEGKNVLSVEDFVRGYGDFVWSVLV